MTPFEKVLEFHEKFSINSETVPALPERTVRELREDLLEEEYIEYVEAEEADDLVEIADALTDIIYIALGTGAAYGLPMDELFDEVHRSNMSKLDPDTGLPIYREDGKVLKGKSYSKPDLASIIERHQAAAAAKNG